MLNRFTWVLLIAFSLGIIWWIFATKNPLTPGNESHPFSNSSAMFELVDPEMAPDQIKPLVMQGYHILSETKKYLPEYAGDRLSCNNCHFAAGNTLGGANSGISLVGVTKNYPKFLAENPNYTLADRINACFEKSLNGKALPVDSQPMKAMLAYLEWISHHITMKKAPWLGLKELRSHHTPDSIKGQEVYAIYCASCHGAEGQGEPRAENLSYPPLWGASSFNEAAGMNNLSKLSAFVYYNMPFGEAELTVEQALDVSAFIIAQPKPKWKGEGG